MIKVIELENGAEVKLTSSAAFLYIYKNEFKRDPLADVFKLIENLGVLEEGQQAKETLEGKSELELMQMFKGIDLTILNDLAWALAKTAKKDIGAPIEFYLNNPGFVPLDHIQEIMDLVINSLISTNKLKKK